MSTRSSLAYGDSFHLYHDLMDGEDDVHLELRDVEFDAGRNGVTVRIPIHIWEHIRQYGGFTPSYHLMDDQALLAYVTQEVDERIQAWTAAIDANRSGLIAFCGAAVYGLASEPREKQITQGFECLAGRRAEEREIVQRIEALAETRSNT